MSDQIIGRVASLPDAESGELSGTTPIAHEPDLRLTPVAVSGGYVFKPFFGGRQFLDTINFSNARTDTDFTVKSDSNPTGTENTFEAIKYASLTPFGKDGWRGTTTLAGTGVNIAVDTTVLRLSRGAVLKRVVLTADAATTIKVRQAYGERSGEGGGAPVFYSAFNGTSTGINANMDRGLPALGIAKAPAVGKQRVAMGMVAMDGLSGHNHPGSGALEFISPGFQVFAINYGRSSSGGKLMPLAAGVPVVLEFVYFASSLTSLRDFQLAAGRARAAASSIEGDLFRQIMGATARSKLFRSSDTSSAPFMIPGGYAGWTFIRDAFWTCLGLDDPEPGRQILLRFANIISSNRVPTAYLADGLASGVGGGADSNALFLMWMWLLRSRYGITNEGTDLPSGAQRNNVITGLKSVINASNYLVLSPGTFMGSGWLDSITPVDNPASWASALTTGQAWVGLMAGRQFDNTQVSQALLDDVQAAYRSFWNGSYLDWARDSSGGQLTDSGYIEVSALAGEFFANLLFGTKLLTQQQVYGHLDALFTKNLRTLPGGRCFSNIVKADGTYLPPSQFTNPADEAKLPGNYQNGGSWLLWDFVACAVGKYHGYANHDLDAFWSERRRAELAVDAASHEYLCVEDGIPFNPKGTSWPNSQGYGWNTLSAAYEAAFGLKPAAVLG